MLLSWRYSSVSYKSGKAAEACNSSTLKVGKEDKKFRVILNCVYI